MEDSTNATNRRTRPRLLSRPWGWADSGQLAYLRDVGALAPLEPEELLLRATRLSAATREFRLAVYAIPWTQRRVLAMWHEARELGRASNRMSDSFGVHAAGDRERLERCLEQLEAGWRSGRVAEAPGILLEADLSHEILRGLHRELLGIEYLAGLVDPLSEDERRTEVEIGLPLRSFRTRMERVHEAFERMTALKNELAERNLRLVLAVARQFEHLGVPLADLIQEGNAGLLRAIERFDPARGVAFATYAVWWIRHAVVRAVQNHGRTVRLPTHQHAAVRDFRR